MIFLFCIGTSVAVFVTNWTLLTALVIARGFTLYDGVLLLSTGASVDTICRFLSGFVFDSAFMKRYRIIIYNLAMLLNGILMMSLAFSHNYYAMFALCNIQFVSSAVIIGQRQVILADLFGVETLLISLSTTLCGTGICVLVIPALLGKTRHTGPN